MPSREARKYVQDEAAGVSTVSLPLFDFFSPPFFFLSFFFFPFSFLFYLFSSPLPSPLFNFDDTFEYRTSMYEFGCQRLGERSGRQDEGGARIEVTSAFRRENSEISGYRSSRVGEERRCFAFERLNMAGVEEVWKFNTRCGGGYGRKRS